MEKQDFVSQVHRKKPRLKPMPGHIQKSNSRKSVIQSCVEHVFADQKSQTGLFVRTVGITRAASSSLSGLTPPRSNPEHENVTLPKTQSANQTQEPSINTLKT